MLGRCAPDAGGQMANSEISFHSSTGEEGLIQRCLCTSVKQSRSRLQVQEQKSTLGPSSLLENKRPW